MLNQSLPMPFERRRAQSTPPWPWSWCCACEPPENHLKHFRAFVLGFLLDTDLGRYLMDFFWPPHLEGNAALTARHHSQLKCWLKVSTSCCVTRTWNLPKKWLGSRVGAKNSGTARPVGVRFEVLLAHRIPDHTLTENFPGDR